MKKSLLILTLLFFSGVASAQSANKEQLAVQQTIQNMFTALSNNDTAGLRLFGTADIKFYEYGQVWTVDTLIQKVIQGANTPGFKRTNSFEFVNTTIHKNTAWVTYYLQSTFTRNGKEDVVKWMETVVIIKQKKQWKIDVLHSTRLPKN